MALTVFVNVQSMVKRKRRKVMKEFKVTVTSNLTQIYYVQAEDWEKAEEIVVLTEVDPDSEEFTRVEMETEEA